MLSAGSSLLGDLSTGGRLDDLRARCVYGEVSRRLFSGVEVPATTIDRYTLIKFIGAGARGGVYLAHDPRVGRNVAIKVLRDEATGDSQESDRLLREAVAMGRLSHPNVVQVYDSGLANGEVYVVMELVEGPSLDAWLRQKPRSWATVVDAFLQAGRGLAAAHAAGLVHRDFKPANVLVGSDGRVRVGDFGLAVADGTPSERGERVPTRLTSQTHRQGTPAYMAPEQLEGSKATPESDQFSFCLALYEGLFGNRPPGAKVLASAGSRLPGSEDSLAIPSRLRRAVVRGTSLDPAERWPSMAALLKEIEQCTPGRRRARFVRGLLLGSLAVAAVLVGAFAKDETSVCEHGAADALEPVWNASRRAQLDEQVDASSASIGWPANLARLDAFFEDWAAAHRDACEATHVYGRQSGHLLDLRMSCLDHALVRADVLLEVLEEDQASDHHQTIAALPQVDLCGDLDALQAAGPTAPPELERQILRTAALYDVGALEEADALARELSERAALEGFPRIAARADYERGKSLAARGRPDQGEPLLENAFFEATRADDDGLAIETAATLCAVGIMRSEPEHAQRWLRHAEALGGAQVNDDQVALVYLTAEGGLAAAQGDYKRAVRLRQEETERATAVYGETSLQALGAFRRQAQTLVRVGRALDAKEVMDRSLRLAKEHLAPEHRELADQYRVAGGVAVMLKDEARADELLGHALEIYETRGEHPLELAVTAISLGRLASGRGDYERALALYDRAHTLRVQVLGAHNVETLLAANAKGAALYAAGHNAEAAEIFVEALAVLSKELGTDHPDVAFLAHNLGLTEVELGQPQAAREHFQLAMSALESAGAGHDALGQVLDELAKVSNDLGRYDEALTHAERRLALGEAAEVADEQLAEAREQRERALRALGRL